MTRQGDALADLIALAQAGDQAAWEELHRRYERRLRGRVRANFGGSARYAEESIDVLQSVWREAVRGLGSYEHRSESSFLAWVSAIVKHKLSGRRRRPPEPSRIGEGRDALLPGTDPSPSECASAAEERERLIAVLQRLPAEQRQLLQWVYFEHAGIPDLAERLHVGIDAARMRLARAEARLAALLQAGRHSD